MPVNTSALHHVSPTAVRGKFFRLIRRRFAHEPLSMFGSIEEGGRYNVVGLFGALYLGFDQQTCEAEVSQGIASDLPFRPGAFILWDYDVNLQSVIRLDDPSVRTQIGITHEEITVEGDHQWASSIGEPLFNRGVEGLVAPSAHHENGRCLDIYLDNLNDSSTVEPLNQLREWPARQAQE